MGVVVVRSTYQSKCPQSLRRESLQADVLQNSMRSLPRAELNQPMLDNVTLLSQPKASGAANLFLTLAYMPRAFSLRRKNAKNVFLSFLALQWPRKVARSGMSAHLLDGSLALCTMISATGALARMNFADKNTTLFTPTLRAY